MAGGGGASDGVVFDFAGVGEFFARLDGAADREGEAVAAEGAGIKGENVAVEARVADQGLQFLFEV